MEAYEVAYNKGMSPFCPNRQQKSSRPLGKQSNNFLKITILLYVICRFVVVFDLDTVRRQVSYTLLNRQ